MKTLIIGLLLTGSLASATPTDVLPKELFKGSLYVKVTKLNSDRVKFEKCYYGFDSTCKQIGKNKFYSISDLDNQFYLEKAQVAGAVIADLAITIVGMSVGAAVIGVAGGTLGVALGATIVPAVAMDILPSIDPVEQYQQSETIDDEVINDEEVKINTSGVQLFIDRLELVLNKID